MKKKKPVILKNNKPLTEGIDYSAFEAQAMAALKDKNLDALAGSNGLFTELYKKLLEKALEGELDQHMIYEEEQVKNRKNGKTKKTVRSQHGNFELQTPRDRNGTFEPELVKKRQVFLGAEIESKIVSLFSYGVSYKNIEEHVREMYGIDVSPALISAVTDKVLPEIEQWQNRPLNECYPVIWMDAMHFKVRVEGRVKAMAVYVIIAINEYGVKEILGLYLSEKEGARFWLQILTHLQSRGLKDIFIACIDNLTGFVEAIQGVFPQVQVQLCIIHQIRNSIKYVMWKDMKEFIEDLKKVYKSPSESGALQALEELDKKWGKKYAVVIKSWRSNWSNLSTYFNYSDDIRRMMYTTNIIEGFNRQVRKVTKTKGNFTSETALMKVLYLASRNIDRKWMGVTKNWKLIAAQFAILFEDRFDLEKSMQHVSGEQRY
jgi:putative transposase